MEIKRVVLPIVADSFDRTVKFYRKISGKEVSISAANDGYKLCAIDNFVVLGAVDGPGALEIPSLVDAIFVVDELETSGRTILSFALCEPYGTKLEPLDEQ